MPRPAKPARLSLRRQGRCEPIWYILHRGKWLSTGCGEGEVERAEILLKEYLGDQRSNRERRDNPNDTLIADVIALYADDIVPTHARPRETAARLERVLDFFEAERLADLNGQKCRQFSGRIGSDSSARRHLQDLKAAINHYRKEVYGVDIKATLWMPDKEERREEWLDRPEVARFIWTAWRRREIQKGNATKRAPWKHAAKWALVALYTGSRAGVVCAASFYPEDGRGFIDVENGVFYRKPPRSRRTKKRAPIVRLPQRLLAHLRRWKRNGQRYPVEFNGTPVSTVKRHFPKIVAAAGLRSGVTAHTFRHTAATWAMRNRRGDGTDPSFHDQAEYLGMTVDTFLTVYGHHAPDHLQAAGELIAKRPANIVTKQHENPRTEAEHGGTVERKTQ